MDKLKEVTAKAKAAVTGHSDSHTTSSTTTHTGPHQSGLANQADPRVDSDRDASRNVGMTGGTTHGTHTTGGLTGTHGTHGTHGTTGTTGTYTAGPHDSNIANKVDPRVDSDRDGSRNVGMTGGTTHGTHTTGGLTGTHGTHGTHGNTGTTGTYTDGPHNSNLANKLDPRVDSDRDGSRNVGNTTHGTHNTGGLTGTHGTTGTTGTYTDGPHNSNLANKLDPRVDSDRDGSRNVGNTTHGTHNTGGFTGTHGTHNTGGLTGTHGTTGTTGTYTAGPHDSNLANKLDPRVDSDRDGSRNVGNTTHGTHNTGGFTGTHGTTGTTGTYTAGPHDSNFANKVDPRVDSDRDGSRNVGMTGGTSTHTGTHGTTGLTGTHGTTGTSHNTAGPHKSDLANKLDPRVDSDLDGSRNMGMATGQNTTYNQATGPPDASKHNPSTFAKLTGGKAPEMGHTGDPEDHRRRHSVGIDAAATNDKYGSGIH